MGALAVLARGCEIFSITGSMCHPNPPFVVSGTTGAANSKAPSSICAKTHKGALIAPTLSKCAGEKDCQGKEHNRHDDEQHTLCDCNIEHCVGRVLRIVVNHNLASLGIARRLLLREGL